MSLPCGCVAIPGGGSGGRCLVSVGTCGYSYREWVDSGYYPAGTGSGEMLALYARTFEVVELNYTWYQMARPEPLTRMLAKAPSHLRFAAKLTRSMTHERGGNLREQLCQYRQGIEPLADRLLAVLVQLPPDFGRTTENRRYLAALLDGLAGLPVAVEFRHDSWVADSVFAELVKRKVSLVTVDVPGVPGLFPTLDVVTNPELFYVRFHGRNLQGWRSANMQKKFDYSYSEAELREWQGRWLDRLAVQAGRGVLFFNNHVGAQAPRNGGSLLKILQGSAVCG